MGASFDVASIAEFMLVYENIRNLSADVRQNFIWDKVIYSNPIKDRRTLEELDPYKPLVAFDNYEEIRKIKKHAPHAGLALRIRVPNTGSMVELSSKFGASPAEAVDLIAKAFDAGLVVEGLGFHVGSQCTNFENYVQALSTSAAIIEEAEARGYSITLLDIGGGFPVRYDRHVRPFRELARILNAELSRMFPPSMEILAEPGRFMVGTAATVVAEVIGKSERDGKRCYYINDGIYHTYSGILFDHCQYSVKSFKKGSKRISAVFGPTCDALDTISQAEALPELKLGDLVYSENIGAYSHASSTYFNGFPPAKVLHINQ
jgi:ornithine decarboxylase